MNDFIEYSYLCHHGIKGMHWGIRRYQNPDGTLTSAGRLRYNNPTSLNKTYSKFKNKENAIKSARNLGVVGSVALGVASLNPLVSAPLIKNINTLAKDSRNKLIEENNPIKKQALVIKKGTTFKRTSLNEQESENKRLYVALSKSKVDMDYYGKEWGNFLRKITNNPNAKVYQNTYKVNTELIAPSLEQRKAAAQAIVNADKKIKTEFGKEFARSQLRLASGNLKDLSVKELLNSVPTERKQEYKTFYENVKKNIIKAEKLDLMNDDTFRNFTSTIPTSEKLMGSYITELKKQGFTAVFDDNANSVAPFIVFDSSMLTQTKSKEINKRY